MEKTERTEKRKQAIRRALDRWFDQRNAETGNEVHQIEASVTTTDTVTMKTANRKEPVGQTDKSIVNDSREQGLFPLKKDQSMQNVFISSHTVSLKRGPPQV